MKSPDPASLQNLNDIVLPATISWFPLTGGWYFLIGISLLTIVWISYRSIRHWIRNRYRRAALRELQLLTEGIRVAETRDSSLRQLPVLLKRTALSAYPRDKVASLNGTDWYGFLNAQLNTAAFTDTTTCLLDNISYSTGNLDAVDAHATTALLGTIKHWLKHHRSATRSQADRKA